MNNSCIDGAGNRINRELLSQQQPKNKPHSKSSAIFETTWHQTGSKVSAGCTSQHQRKNKGPTISRRAAEAELKQGAERTENKRADKRGTDKPRPRAQQDKCHQCRISGVASGAPRIQPKCIVLPLHSLPNRLRNAP
jgi:hypothetical protein